MPTTPTDPLYASQWHFPLLGDIETIWDEYTGAGVTVAVYDDGLQYTHPDLAGNYDPSMHFSFGGITYDPTPVATDDGHGTAVAGLIGAAEGNGIGGVGVAWDVTLTGVNFLSDIQYLSSTIILASLEYAANFDIMNNSWGSTPNFNTWQSLADPTSWRSQMEDAYEVAVDTGRGGLGTIIVQAAGNDTMNANGDGLHASRFTVTVAATESDGNVASYSNYGSNILIAAPAAAVTTDLTGADGYDPGNYTTGFNGTSAATPVTSGVIALMLEANPGLGWRDVQNILAVSASLTGSAIGGAGTGFEQGDWFTNGAGNWNGGGNAFSLSYGFGMLDAFAAVRMAEVWGIMFTAPATSVNEMTVSMSSGTINLAIADLTTSTNSMLVTSDLNIEKIMVTVDFTHTYSGALEIYLIAPDGTRYMLSDVNFGINAAGSGLEWSFGVTGALDMSSLGSWTLEVTDTDAFGDTGVVTDWSIDFFGSAVSNNDVHHFTDDYLTMVAFDPSRGVISDTNGGIDWLNFAAITDDLQIDLAAGTGSATGYGQIATLAPGTEIENIVSGDGNDTLTGNNLANELHAMRGNDTLFGATGNDMLYGGTGDDTLYGGNNNDRLFGGIEVDILRGGTGQDRLFGQNGDDLLRGDNGNDTLFGGTGADTLFGGNQFDLLRGGSGADRLFGEAGYDVLRGEAGNDTLYGGTGNDTLYGDDQFDLLRGGADQDVLNGGNGNDTLRGDAGFDTLFGGTGNDQLYGGTQSDLLRGGADQDTLFGEAGDDILRGEGGFDTLYGGSGLDTLYGGDQGDSLFGGAAQDRLFGENGNDTMLGDSGNDTLYGGTGNDYLDGGGQSDALFGGANNDFLFGDGGNDTLNGGAGNDDIYGGAGNDLLTGGTGSDLFVFFDGFGADTIVGFEATNNAEKIYLSSVTGITDMADLLTQMAQIGSDVVITEGADSITLLNVTLGDLDAFDFVF